QQGKDILDLSPEAITDEEWNLTEERAARYDVATDEEARKLFARRCSVGASSRDHSRGSLRSPRPRHSQGDHEQAADHHDASQHDSYSAALGTGSNRA